MHSCIFKYKENFFFITLSVFFLLCIEIKMEYRAANSSRTPLRNAPQLCKNFVHGNVLVQCTCILINKFLLCLDLSFFALFAFFCMHSMLHVGIKNFYFIGTIWDDSESITFYRFSDYGRR
jgi:hypothetical protein